MHSPHSGNLILLNGWILTDPDSPQVVPHDMTVVRDGRLEKVNISRIADLPETGVLDCTGCLVMPGLVNCHTHAAMSILRGIADDLPLDRWLNGFIFPAERRYVSPAFVELGTRLSCIEMALNGITTFADGYFHMESAAAAAIEVGLRGIIAQGILDVPVPDAPLPGSWKERAATFLDGCPNNPLITPALFCHSPYLCGPDTLAAAAELARKHGTLLFSHVGETAWEVSEINGRYGRTPVAHLRELDVLGPGFVCVHGVHLTDSDRDILAQTRTPVVHCPESNMKLASGAAPIRDLRQRGVVVGIGTDGPASNNNLDLFEEMRSASFMAKLVGSDPEALSAADLVRMATTDGARALGMADRIGSLLPGKAADVVAIDLDRPHLIPMYDALSHLVYAVRGSDVRHVVVHGRIVVGHGRIITVDDGAVKEEVRALSRKIGADLGIPNALQNRPKGDLMSGLNAHVYE